jgi:transposase InsO family protein
MDQFDGGGSTWAGFVYVAFVIDAFARRIVGWRASRTDRSAGPQMGACVVQDAMKS